MRLRISTLSNILLILNLFQHAYGKYTLDKMTMTKGFRMRPFDDQHHHHEKLRKEELMREQEEEIFRQTVIKLVLPLIRGNNFMRDFYTGRY